MVLKSGVNSNNNIPVVKQKYYAPAIKTPSNESVNTISTNVSSTRGVEITPSAIKNKYQHFKGDYSSLNYKNYKVFSSREEMQEAKICSSRNSRYGVIDHPYERHDDYGNRAYINLSDVYEDYPEAIHNNTKAADNTNAPEEQYGDLTDDNENWANPSTNKASQFRGAFQNEVNREGYLSEANYVGNVNSFVEDEVDERIEFVEDLTNYIQPIQSDESIELYRTDSFDLPISLLSNHAGFSDSIHKVSNAASQTINANMPSIQDLALPELLGVAKKIFSTILVKTIGYVGNVIVTGKALLAHLNGPN